MTKTGPGLTPGSDRKRFSMAKTSQSKQRASATSEPTKPAPASPSESRVKGRPAGEAPRPLLEAKAPPAKTPQRGMPAASPRIAKDKAPAPRQAERRQRSEIQTAPAPAEPLESAAPAQAEAVPAAGGPPRRLAEPPGEGAPPPAPDVDALAHNIALAIEQGFKVLAAYL